MTMLERPTDHPNLGLNRLTVPLAIGVFVIAAGGTLFRPAFTVNSAPVPVTATPIAAPGKDVFVDARVSERNAGLTAPGAVDLPTGRSVDIPKLTLPSDEVARLYARGQALVEAGDFAAARLLLSRAADAGNAPAMFALASTYDPHMLAARRARGLVGEPDQAKALYARALAAGIDEARQRMAALGG